MPVGESSEFESAAISEQVSNNQSAAVRALKDDLEGVEGQLEKLVSMDNELKHLFRLITSVEGVGPVTAREIIIATAAFTKFTPEQAKMFARYCGLTPLRKWSGKSVRKPDKTSKKANMKMKGLLTMGAQCLIHRDTELGCYYRRKMADGKKHLVVINAMRNKIVHRVFAVVRNQDMYKKNLNVCLD